MYIIVYIIQKIGLEKENLYFLFLQLYQNQNHNSIPTNNACITCSTEKTTRRINYNLNQPWYGIQKTYTIYCFRLTTKTPTTTVISSIWCNKMQPTQTSVWIKINNRKCIYAYIIQVVISTTHAMYLYSLITLDEQIVD